MRNHVIPKSPKAKKPAAKAVSKKQPKGKKMTQHVLPFTPKDNPTSSRNVATYNHTIPESVDPALVEILTRFRRHESAGERAFCEWLAAELTRLGHKPTLMHQAALVVEIPAEGGARSTTLFSCHVDTVDHQQVAKDAAETEVARKKLDYDANFGLIMLAKDNDVGSCLGADDGAGVWIMLKMIEAGVPGGYIFNRGEEIGGVGSKEIVAKEKDWLATYHIAVAFDRPRCNEVITHQRSKRTCSDKFAIALSTALNGENTEFDYKPSDSGVYTDTAEFASVVSECTNVGVGYINQHGATETLDYAHLHALMLACIGLKWETLPADRDPSKTEWKNYGYTPTKSKAKSWYSPDDYSDGYGGYYGGDYNGYPTSPKTPSKSTKTAPEPNIEDEILESGGLLDWVDIAGGDPELAAETIVCAAAELKSLRAKVAALQKAIKSTR